MATRRAVLRRTIVILAAVALLIGMLAALAVAKPGQDKPGASPDRRYVEAVVQIPAGDHDIPATLVTPRRGGPRAAHPGVLLVHGFASSRDEVGDMYLRLSKTLAAHGYASLRIDFAGSGDSTQPFVDNTFDGMVSDTRIALDYMDALSSIDDDRIGIVGFSLGSRIAAVVSGTDDRVAAFATWSGAVANGRTNFADTFDAYYDVACPASSAIVDLGFRIIELSCEWFESIDASTAQTAIGGFDGPILAIAGTEDTVVDPTWSRRLALDTGSLDYTLRILEGADHIYNVLTPDQALAEQVLDLTGAWFDEKL